MSNYNQDLIIDLENERTALRAELERKDILVALLRDRVVDLELTKLAVVEDSRNIEAMLYDTCQERDRYRAALEDFAEMECSYGDGCPGNAGTRHGTCIACQAKKALNLPTT